MALFNRNKSLASEPKERGKLIVIEGTDGSGKATQTELLGRALEEHGYDGAIISFPQYEEPSAYLVEKYLAGEFGDLNAKATSILYAVDRFDMSQTINRYLNDGLIVLADRYVISNAGHQGSKISDRTERVNYYKWLNNLEYEIFGIPKPDLNLILHVPTEISSKLIQSRSEETGRSTDIHEQDIEHLKRAEQTYLELADLTPNTKVIKCVQDGQLLSPNDIHIQVWELVRRIVLKTNTF